MTWLRRVSLPAFAMVPPWGRRVGLLCGLGALFCVMSSSRLRPVNDHNKNGQSERHHRSHLDRQPLSFDTDVAVEKEAALTTVTTKTTPLGNALESQKSDINVPKLSRSLKSSSRVAANFMPTNGSAFDQGRRLEQLKNTLKTMSLGDLATRASHRKPRGPSRVPRVGFRQRSPRPRRQNVAAVRPEVVRTLLVHGNKTSQGRVVQQRTSHPTIEPECEFQPVSLTASVLPNMPQVDGTLAVIGIARNIGRSKIRHAMQAITTFAESVFGGRFHVFFVENDSNDCTGTALTEWAQLDRNRVSVETGRLGRAASRVGDHLQRIQRLSQYRNRALTQMLNSAHGPFDYVLVIDLDLLPLWTAETLAQPFRLRQENRSFDFDMVCANGVMSESDNRYYDAFAFRSNEYPHGPLDVSPYFGGQGYVTRVMSGLRRKETDDPVPVESCFGGLAFYRASMFAQCKYSSVDGDCEHVHIHRCMRKLAAEKQQESPRFWMLPAMKVVYDLDETELNGYGVA